jgi:hypothetical protein
LKRLAEEFGRKSFEKLKSGLNALVTFASKFGQIVHRYRKPVNEVNVREPSIHISSPAERAQASLRHYNSSNDKESQIRDVSTCFVLGSLPRYARVPREYVDILDEVSLFQFGTKENVSYGILGSGGQAIVFSIETSMQEFVAVKVFSCPAAHSLRLFEINHIIQARVEKFTKDRRFITKTNSVLVGTTMIVIMPLVRGFNLLEIAQLLSADEALAATCSLSMYQYIAYELVSMLRSLHTSRIAHRDVTLCNVMIQEDGALCLVDFDTAYCDFGIASHFRQWTSPETQITMASQDTINRYSEAKASRKRMNIRRIYYQDWFGAGQILGEYVRICKNRPDYEREDYDKLRTFASSLVSCDQREALRKYKSPESKVLQSGRNWLQCVYLEAKKRQKTNALYASQVILV